jgi:hypothetical protein
VALWDRWVLAQTRQEACDRLETAVMRPSDVYVINVIKFCYELALIPTKFFLKKFEYSLKKYSNNEYFSKKNIRKNIRILPTLDSSNQELLTGLQKEFETYINIAAGAASAPIVVSHLFFGHLVSIQKKTWITLVNPKQS